MAAVANIAAVIPGAYCAYGTWELLHPSTPSVAQIAPESHATLLVSLLVAAGLVVFAAILNSVASFRKSRSSESIQTIGSKQLIASSALTSPAPSPIDVEVYFHQTYSGQIQAEVEGNVRAMIQSRHPSERDEFVIRFIARGLVNVTYDRIWLTIFRSQVLALVELNRTVLRREQLQTYYDGGVQRSPDVYATYPFDEWLKYLRGQLLVLEHPGQTFEITVRGKDFLKYMVHCGYSADGRNH